MPVTLDHRQPLGHATDGAGDLEHVEAEAVEDDHRGLDDLDAPHAHGRGRLEDLDDGGRTELLDGRGARARDALPQVPARHLGVHQPGAQQIALPQADVAAHLCRDRLQVRDLPRHAGALGDVAQVARERHARAARLGGTDGPLKGRQDHRQHREAREHAGRHEGGHQPRGQADPAAPRGGGGHVPVPSSPPNA